MDKSQDRTPLRPAAVNDDEEEEDFAHVPFDDDEEEEQPAAAAAQDDSLLQLSGAADISGLDTTGIMMDESHDSSSSQKRPASELKRKRRKRRKVIVDNDATELDNEQIKAMLADTSDIVKRQAHPADDEDFLEEEEVFVPILTQPFVADGGNLHPALQKLWRDNFYRALDLPCPFEKLADDEIEQARQAPQDDEEDDDDEEHSEMMQPEEDGPHPQQPQDEEEDDFAVPPMDDEEEDDDNNMVVAMDDEEEEDVAAHAAGGIGDLGLVNELQMDSDEDEDDEEKREAVGEHTGTKWHKHTVKVLKLLQSRMRPEEDDDEEDEKPTSLEFGELAKHVNRRTAASCFIECLVRPVSVLGASFSLFGSSTNPLFCHL